MRRPRLFAPAVPLAAVLAAVLTVAGCSIGAGPRAGAERTAASAAPSASPSGAQAPGDVVDAEAFLTHVETAMAAQPGYQVTMRLTLPGTGPVSLTARSSTTPRAIDETIAVPGQDDVRVRLVGDVFYLNYGALSRGKWVTVDTTDQDDPVAQQFAKLLASVDPAGQLGGLTGAVTGVRHVGLADVDGWTFDRYDVTVDVAKMTTLPSFGEMSDEQRDAFADVVPSLTYSYWLDDQFLPRKSSVEAFGVSSVGMFSHWGEPVTIHAPATSQILPGGIAALGGVTS